MYEKISSFDRLYQHKWTFQRAKMALGRDWIFKSALKNTRHKVNFLHFKEKTIYSICWLKKKNQGHVIMIFFHLTLPSINLLWKKRTQYLKIILLLNSWINAIPISIRLKTGVYCFNVYLNREKIQNCVTVKVIFTQIIKKHCTKN